MAKKDYHNWLKGKLVHEIEELLKRKRFGLVWEDKKEDVAEQCKDRLPVLEEKTKKQIITSKKDIDHIFIEGDNYHALSVLNYTHKKKIDVIFIDPPYNTGSKSWIYNNNYVEKDDRFRHSKWLSFMAKRLRLARTLLKDDGFFIVTIDDHELFTLGLLMDEIFGEHNRLGIVTIVHNPKGRNFTNWFSANSEFMLVYAKNNTKARFNSVAIDEKIKKSFNLKEKDGRQYRLEPFLRSRTETLRENKPAFWYPIYVSKDLKQISTEKKKGCYEVYPIASNGKEATWINLPETFEQKNRKGLFVVVKEKNFVQIYRKFYEQQIFKNVWVDQKYQSEFHGTNLLKKIFGDKRFDYPKSLYLVMDILKITAKEDAVILDFFAGSGTTGHAVLELNNEDGGNRQFIICTNNENNNGNGYGGVAKGVCCPRISKVIKGYTDSTKTKIAGLGGNLKYYKTTFVNNVKTDNDKRIFTAKSTEMLCLAENTFEKVASKKNQYAVFQNKKQMTGIIYDEDHIIDFKKEIKKHKKPVVVYVFSYDHTYNEEDFADMENLKKAKPIPEVILNVYRKIYKNLYKLRRI